MHMIGQMIERKNLIIMTDYRKGFTQRFFKFLDDKKYALLKWDGTLEALTEKGSDLDIFCLLYTSPSPRDATLSRMPSSA